VSDAGATTVLAWSLWLVIAPAVEDWVPLKAVVG
jgi:hypothetical protein